MKPNPTDPQSEKSNGGATIGYEADLWAMADALRGSMDAAEYKHVALGAQGIAGFVLANGSMSSKTSGEGKIREAIVEDDLVDCMVALPGQLFYSTQIPVCLWFLARDRSGGGHRDRIGKILFIDARKMGHMVDRTHRELSDQDIARIADTYHAWKSRERPSKYADAPGFCKSAALEEVRKHDHVLTPGRYVGFQPPEKDPEPFAEKMVCLSAQWREQQKESARLDAAIEANLTRLGFGSPVDKA